MDGVWEPHTADSSELDAQLTAAGRAVKAAYLQLSRESTRLHDELTRNGALSQQQVAIRAGCSRSAISKLQNRDGDERWELPTAAFYQRLERAFGRLPVCSQLRQRLREREEQYSQLAGIARNRVLGADIEQEDHDAHLLEVQAYLRALHQALDRTLPWHPAGGMDRAFARRQVKMLSSPLPAEPADQRMHLHTRQVAEGDVDWEEAVPPLRLGVVLGDAGYGKTWLLRRHARHMCEQAMTALEQGKLLRQVEIPLWMHAADLANTWHSGREPAAALLDAAAGATRVCGFVPSRELRGLFADRLSTGASGLCVHVDAYDEVFDDLRRDSLAEALCWLGGLVRQHDGLRLLMTSRPVGFVSPFPESGGGPPVRYLLLGALSADQVRALWRRWYTLKDLPHPVGRLGLVLQPDSPLRGYARVPLIAAFCAWVAEDDRVRLTVAGLFDQVVQRFIAQQWKHGDHAPPGSVTRRDAARQALIRQALEQLAWHMATAGPGWSDAVTPGECEQQLARSGLDPLPGWTRAGELTRVLGVLIQLGDTGADSGKPIMWVHPSLHQFLTAHRLIQLPGPEIDRWVALGYLRPEWAETLRFCVELETGDATP